MLYSLALLAVTVCFSVFNSFKVPFSSYNAIIIFTGISVSPLFFIAEVAVTVSPAVNSVLSNSISPTENGSSNSPFTTVIPNRPAKTSLERHSKSTLSI